MPMSDGAKGFLGSVSIFCGQIAVIWAFLALFKRQEEKATRGRGN